jgi:N-acetylglucosamine-6-sulfatase
VLDIAGVNDPGTIQGKSLVPLIRGEKDQLRTSGLIEYYSNENPFPWTAQLDYRVVITDQFKYIKWLRFDSAELYDLKNDPYEQRNLIGEPSYRKTVEELHGELQKLQLEALGLN